MTQPTLEQDPKTALNNGIDTLQQFARGELPYVYVQGIISAIQKLEGAGTSTKAFTDQITPEVMTGVLRQNLSNCFRSLCKALVDFETAEFPTRVANLAPNLPDHINSYATLAARYEIKVSDLFLRDFERQMAGFEVLWERREHSYGSGGFRSPLVPLMEIAFPRQDMSELRMPTFPAAERSSS
jgi:hypothetical protein